jgi:hypothetical protein
MHCMNESKLTNNTWNGGVHIVLTAGQTNTNGKYPHCHYTGSVQVSYQVACAGCRADTTPDSVVTFDPCVAVTIECCRDSNPTQGRKCSLNAMCHLFYAADTETGLIRAVLWNCCRDGCKGGAHKTMRRCVEELTSCLSLPIICLRLDSQLAVGPSTLAQFTAAQRAAVPRAHDTVESLTHVIVPADFVSNRGEG